MYLFLLLPIAAPLAAAALALTLGWRRLTASVTVPAGFSVTSVSDPRCTSTPFGLPVEPEV